MVHVFLADGHVCTNLKRLPQQVLFAQRGYQPRMSSRSVQPVACSVVVGKPN